MKFVITQGKFMIEIFSAYPSGAALNASLNASLAKFNSVKRYKRTNLFKTVQKVSEMDKL
jgi:hypothetical protein